MDNVIHLKRRNGPWDERYFGFLNEGNCETSNLVLIKLMVAAFRYLILFHWTRAPYRVTQVEENVGTPVG